MPGPRPLGPMAECRALREGRTGALRLPERRKTGSLDEGIRESASSDLTLHKLTDWRAAIEGVSTPPHSPATSPQHRRQGGTSYPVG